MNKKLIIIALAGGLVSFAVMFILAWFITMPSKTGPSAEVVQTSLATDETFLKLPQPQATTTNVAGTINSKMKKAMTEKQLKSLVYELQEKIEEYDKKLEELKLREQRLQVAGNTLKKDIEQLDDLRIELASTVARLKTEQDKLLKSRIEIAGTEKSNLISIAASYDKMDSVQAGKILTNMSQDQNSNSDEDAVKLLHYMSERTKAKILASIAETEPAISAHFCQRLKQIIEKD